MQRVTRIVIPVKAFFYVTPAPAGGSTVTLSSDNANVLLPASVTVPAGMTSATFNITTTTVLSQSTAHITGAVVVFPPGDSLANGRAYLTAEDSLGEVEMIRRRSMRSRPLGTDAFIAHLETLAGKPLNRERGRPRKKVIDD